VTLVAFIESQYQAEQERRTQLVEAAARQLATSAAFVALIVAVASLALGKDFTVAAGSDGWAIGARVLVLVASATFAAAGLLAAWVQAVRPVVVVSGAALDDMLTKPIWQYSEVQARNLKAIHLVRTTKSMRSANRTRAKYYKAASWVQALGVALVLAAIACSFLARPVAGNAATPTNCVGGACVDSGSRPAPSATGLP
jgi:hypothetical protein